MTILTSSLEGSVTSKNTIDLTFVKNYYHNCSGMSNEHDSQQLTNWQWLSMQRRRSYSTCSWQLPYLWSWFSQAEHKPHNSSQSSLREIPEVLSRFCLLSLQKFIRRCIKFEHWYYLTKILWPRPHHLQMLLCVRYVSNEQHWGAGISFLYSV